MQATEGSPDSVHPSSDASDGTAEESISAGGTITERYYLDREAVRTEAGMVYDATDLTTNARVAVEVASSIVEPRARSKWERDAMLAQRLEGDHVLHVIDAGALPNGVPFIVREASTTTLADELGGRGALPLAEAVGYTLDACEAVAEGHALGMAHGDLRLDNIHLASGPNGPTVKVSWTSAAKAERAAKEDVARDIAGLGALLRVLATGRLDMEADGAPTLPSEVATTVARALNEDPEGTFNDVAELARSLAPFAPPGHRSARSVALIMSRAGVVDSPLPAAAAHAAHSSPRISLAPVSSRIIDRSSERVSGADWFARSASPRTSRTSIFAEPPPRKNHGALFAFVSLALIGLVLGGTWLLFQNGKLPRWSGAAPPEEVGTTQVTNATASDESTKPSPNDGTLAEAQKVDAEERAKANAADAVARAKAADESTKAAAAKSTAVESLPNAAPANAPATNAPATNAPAATQAPAAPKSFAPAPAAKPKSEPRYDAPAPSTPAPEETAPTTRTPSEDPGSAAPATSPAATTPTPEPSAAPVDPVLGF